MTLYEKFNEVVELLGNFGLDSCQAQTEALRLFSEEEKKEIIRINQEEEIKYARMIESSRTLVVPVVPEDIPW